MNMSSLSYTIYCTLEKNTRCLSALCKTTYVVKKSMRESPFISEWEGKERMIPVYIYQDGSVQLLATFSSWLCKQQCSPHIWDEEVPNSSVTKKDTSTRPCRDQAESSPAKEAFTKSKNLFYIQVSHAIASWIMRLWASSWWFLLRKADHICRLVFH